MLKIISEYIMGKGKLKILVNVPDLKILGGVASHYAGLRDFWSQKVHYNTSGRRAFLDMPGWVTLPYDLVRFILKVLFWRPDVVLLNPSMGHRALKRDFLYLKLARFFGRRVVVFIHGFNLDYVNGVDRNWLCGNLNKADLIFVLAKEFRSILQEYGVKSRIVLSTTKVNDRLLSDFDIAHKQPRRNILFLARVEQAKGIYITIDSYKMLKSEFPDLTLTIAGSGSELQAVRRYIEDNDIHDVTLLGAISGKELKDVFGSSGLYSFPSYGEGMPTSVLEAMAFGLPVFTRRVGGLVDFFEPDRMGFITDSLDASDFAQAMRPYLEDEALYRKVSRHNHDYAKEHFMASKVAMDIENELRGL